MTIDISRKSFRPRENYAGVAWQQGRVETDAERNEDWAIRDRRTRVQTMDMIGHCGYPRRLPDSFRIEVDGGAITIGAGRMYVDGLLAENHGLEAEDGGTVSFDLPHEEMRGSDPLPFDAQPWRPDVEPPDPGEGRHLVYLDVWRRIVTYLEDQALVEPAIGVDTTGRMQTVWQVRALGGMPSDATCETPDEDLPGWLAATRPSDGRLSSFLIPVDDPDDPCLLPPGAGYRALENRTYRVEIHEQAPDGTWRFKWSRYNGVVATRVRTLLSATELLVAQVAKDDVLRFEDGDWVEIIDDTLELEGQPGIMRMIDVADPGTNRITLRTALPGGVFPTDPDGTPNPDRNLRIRKWDQSGEVRASGGGLLADLTDEAGPGVIDVPPAGESVALEAGIAVSFSFAPGGADSFRVGDWWVFAARTNGATIETLEEAPPRGIHHHYCRLGFVDAVDGEFVAPATDCRMPFPDEGGEGCCTVVVRLGESIQAAIDSLPAAGGCVCLKAGVHETSGTILIARSDVTLEGESQGAVVRSSGDDPVLAIRGAASATPVQGVRVHGIRFEGDDISASSGGAVVVEAALDAAIEDCEIDTAGEEAPFAGIRIATSRQIRLQSCRIFARSMGIWATIRSTDLAVVDCDIETGPGSTEQGFPGIVGILGEDMTGPLLVADNRIRGSLFGIAVIDDLETATLSLARGTVIRTNRIVCAGLAGTAGTVDVAATETMVGIDIAAEDALIQDNEVQYPGPRHIGIRVSGSGARIVDNRCIATGAENEAAVAFGLQIGVEPDRGTRLIGNVEARGNTFAGPQNGLAVVRASEVAIASNHLHPGTANAVAVGALVSDARNVALLDNRFVGAVAAIAAASTGDLRIEGNTIDGGALAITLFGVESPTVARNRIERASNWGIAIVGAIARTQVVGNRVVGCGYRAARGLGIGAYGVLGEFDVDSNEIMNTGNGPDEERAAAAVGLFGELILESRVTGNLITYSGDQIRDVNNEDRALQMRGMIELSVATGETALTLGFPIQILGNKFVGTGRTALVELRELALTDNIAIRFERVTFNDNYCNHASPPELNDTRATVSLEGRRGIVMGNHLNATTPNYFSVNFNFMNSTFLGNVVEGQPIQGTLIPTPIFDYNLDT